MFELFPWIPFLVAISVLTLTPGVDTLMVLRQSVSGWRLGLLASVGICMGLFVHGTLSALGVSVLLARSPELFLIVKWAGAGYLVYLGLLALRDGFKGRSVLTGEAEVISQRSAFYQGFINNLLNPKTLLFYMALLPQFLITGFSPLWQSLMMASVHFFIAMLWQGALVFLVHRARDLMRKRSFIGMLDMMSGSVFLFFGLRIIFDKSLS